MGAVSSITASYAKLGILNNEISNSMVTIPGYKFERLDRNGCGGGGGGGVGCYVKDKYTYVRRCHLESTDLELMWLEIKRVNSSSLFIGIVYRSQMYTHNF